MAAPFCTACGAAIAEGTRFCVKCGQPVGQAAPPVAVVTPPPAPPLQPYLVPAAAVNQASGAGVWIGIFATLLLLGGAAFWFYSMRLHAASSVHVAQASPPAPSVPAMPEVIPSNPDLPPPKISPPKNQAPPQPNVEPVPSVSAPAPSDPAPPPEKAAGPTSGVLHASIEVAQNGEVVFENLPGARLKFTFDHDAWQPTISRQPNGTQTLVMRSLKPGIQTSCDVRWEIVP